MYPAYNVDLEFAPAMPKTIAPAQPFASTQDRIIKNNFRPPTCGRAAAQGAISLVIVA